MNSLSFRTEKTAHFPLHRGLHCSNRLPNLHRGSGVVYDRDCHARNSRWERNASCSRCNSIDTVDFGKKLPSAGLPSTRISREAGLKLAHHRNTLPCAAERRGA